MMAFALPGHVQAKEGKDPVRIGVILPLSGEMASNGAAVYDAYQAAADLTNESGGVNGAPVKLIKGDSPDPAAAQQNAQRMAGDGVKVFIGSLANHLGLAASAARCISRRLLCRKSSQIEDYNMSFARVHQAYKWGQQQSNSESSISKRRLSRDREI
jgi:hypothetical protein